MADHPLVSAALEQAQLPIAPQPAPSTNIHVRPAQPSDNAAVLAFCRNTWEDQDDYIDSVWDRWLTDENGVMLVATLNDIPVAMGRGLMMSDREAWLEGIRVNRCYAAKVFFDDWKPNCTTTSRNAGLASAALASRPIMS